jgi:hypothetical protein
MQNLSRKHKTKKKSNGGFIFPDNHLTLRNTNNLELPPNPYSKNFDTQEDLIKKRTADTVGRTTSSIQDTVLSISRAKPKFTRIGPSSYQKVAKGIFEMPPGENSEITDMDEMFQKSATINTQELNYISRKQTLASIGKSSKTKNSIDLDFEDTDLKDSDMDEPKISRNLRLVHKRVFVDPHRLK